MRFSLLRGFVRYRKREADCNAVLTLSRSCLHPLPSEEPEMDEAQKKEADRRFEDALEGSGARDPRDFYRKVLRDLRQVNPTGYQKAVDHFQEVLVPSIASGNSEPLWAWREYGRLIAEVTVQGRTVSIDETGRAEPFHPDTPMDRLVLHLPETKGGRAILVSLPPSPSQAQRATYDLLVAGKHRIPGS
jgi:hypothetical protein